MRRRRVANGSPTRRPSIAHVSPTRRQRLALNALVAWLVVNIISSPRHPLNATRLTPTPRRYDAGALSGRCRRVAPPTRRRRGANATSTRHRRDADASPTPCLRRSRCLACLQHRSNQSNSSRVDAMPTRADMTPTRCCRVTDSTPTRRQRDTVASPTHRQRLALHAPLLGLSSTSFPNFAVQSMRHVAHRRGADATPTRCRREAKTTPMRRRRVTDAS